MAQSIFIKIINGEIPCHKIYEDEKTFAFLDIHPIQPGHVLVVPKVQVDHLWDLSPEYYMALMDTSRLIANKIRAVLNTSRVGVQVVGIDVPHAHVHLIPFNTIDEFRNVPDMITEPNHEDLAVMAKRLFIEWDN